MSAQGNYHPAGEFRPKPKTEQIEKGGHQIGTEGGPAEFHAEVHPAGTAPQKDAFQPNIGQPEISDFNERDQSAQPSALGGLPGATSSDVHTGLGKPPSGITSQEVHGVRKKDRQGLGSTAGGAVELNSAASRKDAQDFQRQFEGNEDLTKGSEIRGE